MSQEQSQNEVDSFIAEEIDTVPHLEALLLIWNSRPQPWTLENLAQRLYAPADSVAVVLDDLMRRGFVARVPSTPAGYRYESVSDEKDRLLSDVDATYRRELIRISNMIHSKPSASLRAFARAFRLKPEQK